MDLHEHAALSLPAGAVAYLASGDLGATAAVLVGGILIDLDHLVDYWRETGLNADWRTFLGYFDARKPIHSYLPLHAWEWPLQILAVAAVAGAPGWAWGLAAGMLAHLVMDQRYNRLAPLAYLYSYRSLLGFDSRSIYAD